MTKFTQNPQLFYWVRLHSEKGASAEVDYVIAQGAIQVPIEVKAGVTTSLKSLHVFMEMKKLSKAVRVCSGTPHISSITIKNHAGESVNYELRSIPFYLISEIHRLLNH